MEVVFVQAKLREFALELFEVHAEVEQRADEHVAADAAEDVEVEGLHRERDQRRERREGLPLREARTSGATGTGIARAASTLI